jgi:hypothetical protein
VRPLQQLPSPKPRPCMHTVPAPGSHARTTRSRAPPVGGLAAGACGVKASLHGPRQEANFGAGPTRGARQPPRGPRLRACPPGWRAQAVTSWTPGPGSGPGLPNPNRHLMDLVGRHFGQAGVQARERGGREARDHVVGDDHRRDVARAAGRQALGRARGRRKRVSPALQLPARAPRMS